MGGRETDFFEVLTINAFVIGGTIKIVGMFGVWCLAFGERPRGSQPLTIDPIVSRGVIVCVHVHVEEHVRASVHVHVEEHVRVSVHVHFEVHVVGVVIVLLQSIAWAHCKTLE